MLEFYKNVSKPGNFNIIRFLTSKSENVKNQNKQNVTIYNENRIQNSSEFKSEIKISNR